MSSPTPTATAAAPRVPRAVVIAGTAAIVAAVDLATKAWAIAALMGHPPTRIAGQWLRLEFFVNPGVAFGMGGNVPVATIASALLVCAALLWASTRPPLRARSAAVGVGVILGGAAGNLYDRLFRVVQDPSLWGGGERRGVVDFIGVGPWPIFNVADIAVVAGGIAVVVSLVRHQMMRGLS